MPLVKGTKAQTKEAGAKLPAPGSFAPASKEGISENIRIEMHAGKSQKRAIAIALSEARKAGGKLRRNTARRKRAA